MKSPEELLGPNWRTTVTGWLAALTGALTVLAALPYELGDFATVIPADWKLAIVKAGLAATFVLRVIQSHNTKDKQVAGNNPDSVGEGNVATKVTTK